MAGEWDDRPIVALLAREDVDSSSELARRWPLPKDLYGVDMMQATLFVPVSILFQGKGGMP